GPRSKLQIDQMKFTSSACTDGLAMGLLAWGRLIAEKGATKGSILSKNHPVMERSRHKGGP
ncbi:MAG: hypothetical protein EA402_01410, partial [Planctomycetota bacterium]